LLREGANGARRAAGDAAEELLRAAETVMARAHVPYSRFPVGAALRTTDGQVVAAANVENAAYPQGQCAEASAIGAMIAAGGTEIAEVAVVALHLDICPPCSACRSSPGRRRRCTSAAPAARAARSPSASSCRWASRPRGCRGERRRGGRE